MMSIFKYHSRQTVNYIFIFILFVIPNSIYAAWSEREITSNPVTYWGWQPDPDMIGQSEETIEDIRHLVEFRFPDTMNRENSYMTCEAVSTGFINNTGSATAQTYEQCFKKSDGKLIFGYPYSYTFSTILVCADGSMPDLSEPQENQCPDKYMIEVHLNLTCTSEADPCDPSSGLNFRKETDIQDKGLVLNFSRHYSSLELAASDGAMGENWRHQYDKRINHIPVSDHWYEKPVVKSGIHGTPQDACMYGWNDIKSKAYRGLIPSAVPEYQNGVCNLSIQGEIVVSLPVINVINRKYGFPYDSDDVKTISHPNGTEYLFHYVNGAWRNLNGFSVTLQSDPLGLLFTNSDGTHEIYNSDGLIMQSTDQNGHVTTYAYDQLKHLISVTGPKGDSLVFSYNLNGNIETVTGPDGSVTYTYENNHLSTVTYPNNESKQYLYEDTRHPHSITGYIDEKGERFASWSYDEEGRVTMNEQAGGVNHYEFTYNSDGSTTVTDINNAVRTYSFKIIKGNMKIDQVVGDRCTTCSNGDINAYTYDDNGFVISKTDWNGNVTTYIRDNQGRELSRTESSGTPEARTITTTWDTQLNKPLVITEPDRITEYTYDTNGRRLSTNRRPHP
ncbi:MAG: DUF6531 domain-containing protein [Candidatus Thiodiazotropha endolucinida]